jgi:hypothetical protein
MAHTCNPSSGGRHHEGSGFEASPGNSSGDSISKIPITKKGLVEWLKVQALSSNPSTLKKRKNKNKQKKNPEMSHNCELACFVSTSFLVCCHMCADEVPPTLEMTKTQEDSKLFIL